MKRMMKNQFDDYANYVGNSKKIAASKTANKLAEQVDNTEKIRAELMHRDRAAKEKLREIQEYIEETMSEHIEIVKNEANVQKQAIKNAQRDFIENCNVIKTNAQKRHDASTCANCISFGKCNTCI
jgi:predicted nucleic acid-binding protein